MASSHKRLTEADWLDHKSDIQNMVLFQKLSNAQIVDALEKSGLHAKYIHTHYLLRKQAI